MIIRIWLLGARGGTLLDIGLVIDATDQFVLPIEAFLRRRHGVRRFSPHFTALPVVGSSINKVLLDLQLLQFMRAHDVVFFEWAGSLLIKATHMPKVCPIVTRLHSMELATAAHRVDWSNVDATIVNSRHIKRRLRHIADPLPARVDVISNGVDLARFQPHDRPFAYSIGMACRVVPLKRVYEAVLCLAELREDGYPFTLRVAGRIGDDLAPRYPWALLGVIQKLELEDEVSLQGYVEDMASWYQSVDVFLSNSYWEGQQVALLEAMASGCYCLAHWWEGADEILPHDEIYITDRELRAKLAKYVGKSEAEKRQARMEMRAIAEERFDEQRMAEGILEVVESVAPK